MTPKEKSFAYISLLRGINVLGKKTIRMEDLAKLYETLGFKNVRTYVQSGNVLFDSPERDSSKLSALIATGIKKKFGYDVVVLITTGKELSEVIARNPFAKDPRIDKSKLHVTLLSELPKPALLKELQPFPGETDQFKVVGKAVYIHCPNGYGRTKYHNNFFEKVLKTSATTRNWNTVNKLLALVQS